MSTTPELKIQGIPLTKSVEVENNEPLRLACNAGHFDIVKLLIENGADIHVENEICLKIACQRNYIDIVKILLDHGAKINIEHESINNHFEVVNY
jgi:ankyrin repeat protein